MKVRLRQLNRATTEMGANTARHDRSLIVEALESFSPGGIATQITQIRTLHAWAIRQFTHQRGQSTYVSAKASNAAQISPLLLNRGPGKDGKSSEIATSKVK
jgi:hypothetical protein